MRGLGPRIEVFLNISQVVEGSEAQNHGFYGGLGSRIQVFAELLELNRLMVYVLGGGLQLLHPV